MLNLIKNFFTKKTAIDSEERYNRKVGELIETVYRDLCDKGREDLAHRMVEHLEYKAQEEKVQEMLNFLHYHGVHMRDLPNANTFGTETGLIRRPTPTSSQNQGRA